MPFWLRQWQRGVLLLYTIYLTKGAARWANLMLVRGMLKAKKRVRPSKEETKTKSAKQRRARRGLKPKESIRVWSYNTGNQDED